MTIALWSEEKISGQLEAITEELISLSDARALISEIQTDYEIDRVTKETEISDLQKQVNDLTVQNSSSTADVTLTVDTNLALISRFETAITHVDSSDLIFANATAKATGVKTLATGVHWQQKHLLGWGTTDPWPWIGTGTRPPEPTAWTNLDNWLNFCLSIGNRLALNTQLYPWHLRGKWNADGTTTPCVATDAYSDEGVLMTDSVADYLLLIQRMAERYLVAPYNVKIWTTGTEYHGLYRGRDKTFSEWRWDAYPGTPGRNADMGASYIHNITVAKILEVASNLKDAQGKAAPIDPTSLVFINNYPPIIGNGTPTNDSVPVGHPLRNRAWGTANKQGLSILQHMIPLLNRVDAIAMDMSSINRDGVILVADEFDNLDRYDDVFNYIATIVPAKPLVIMETYDKSQHDPGPNSALLRATIRADVFRRMILHGVWSAVVWGTAGEAMGIPSDGGKKADAALLTDTSVAIGGKPMPMFDVMRLYHDNFPPGTMVYRVTSSNKAVNAIASDRVILMYNKTGSPHRVAVINDIYALDPHEIRVVYREGMTTNA